MKSLLRGISFLIVVMLLLPSGEAQGYSTVQVTLPDTSADSGAIVIIPVTVDDVTGKEVYSAEMTLVYDGNILTGYCDSTTTDGTIAEGWGNPTCNSTYGSISIAMAGVTPLSGSGVLVYVAFTVNGSPGDTTTIHFEHMLFNEGDPPSECQDGFFSVPGAPPVCEVSTSSLDFDTVCIGDYSDKTFTITNIGGGTLSGEISESCDNFSLVGSTTYDLGAGQYKDFTVRFQPQFPAGPKSCPVETGNSICSDVDCSGEAVACTVQVALPDTFAASGDTIAIPVYVDGVTEQEIYSVEICLVYDGSILEGNCDLTTTDGTIAEIWGSPTCNSAYGSISIAMAGVTPLSGSGVLVYVAFIVTGSPGDTTTIHFEHMLFNEGVPPSECQDGLFGMPDAPPVCEVSTSSLDFDTVCIGDYSDKIFTITNIGGGTLSGEISESCDDFSLVDLTTYNLDSGELQVFTVRFQPQSAGPKSCIIETGNSICSDVDCSGEAVACTVQVALPDTCADSGDTIAIPIYVDDVTGKDIYSAEITLVYDGNILTGYCDSTTTDGTIAEIWGSPTCNSADGSISIAMAGVTPLSGSGVLVYVAFIVTGSPGDTTTIHFEHMQFNEGVPPSVCQDGFFSVEGASPVCEVSTTSLDFDTVCVGDYSDKTFRITNTGGGTLSGTVNESCTDFSIVGSASYSLGAGDYKDFTVRFQPQFPAGSKSCPIETGNGICSDVDCSGEAVECPAVQVALPDTCAASGDTIAIPIYVDDVTGKDIYSAEITLVYDGSILEGNCDLTTTDGTIAEIWGSPTCNSVDGSISIAMAGVTPLSGSGVLVYVAFIANGSPGDTTTIHFEHMLFNEDDPPSECQDGLFSVGCVVVWYVSNDGNDDTGDGSSDYPFATIQHAVDVAAANDTVRVEAGTYEPAEIVKALVLQAPSGANSTIISGAGRSERCLYIHSVTDTVIVIGFTLRDGDPPGALYYGQGGGMLVVASNVRMEDCLVTENRSPDSGGGISFRDSSYVEINNSRIWNDSCAASGGGIVSVHSKGCKISYTVIDNNEATLNGGGIFLISDAADSMQKFEFSNCVISSNTGGEYGMGLGTCRNNVTIANTIIFANTSLPGATDPYGVFASASVLTLTCSDLYLNQNDDLFADSIVDSLNIYRYPWFCDTTNCDYPIDTTNCDYHIFLHSPCAADNNDCGELIGALDVSCICGDVNADGDAGNIGDIVYLIEYIFGGGPPPVPPLAGDVDCDGSINIGDIVYLITYMIVGEPAPCLGPLCPE